MREEVIGQQSRGFTDIVGDRQTIDEDTRRFENAVKTCEACLEALRCSSCEDRACIRLAPRNSLAPM